MQHDRSLFQPWGEHEDLAILAIAATMRCQPLMHITRAAISSLPDRSLSSIRYRVNGQLRPQIFALWQETAAAEAESAPAPAAEARQPTMRVIVPVPCSTSVSAVDAEVSLPQLPWMPALARASARPETTPDPRHSLVRRSPRPQHPTAALVAEMLREFQKADQ